MKRVRVILAICFIPVWMSACGGTADDGKNDIMPIEPVKMDIETSEEAPEAVDTSSAAEPGAELVSYAGVYNDHDNDEPNLEISQNEDGSYSIRIGIFRLLSLEDGVGQDTGDGIHFSSTDTGLEGTIKLEGDIAIVTFEGDFPYSDIKTYRYYKTADKP